MAAEYKSFYVAGFIFNESDFKVGVEAKGLNWGRWESRPDSSLDPKSGKTFYKAEGVTDHFIVVCNLIPYNRNLVHLALMELLL